MKSLKENFNFCAVYIYSNSLLHLDVVPDVILTCLIVSTALCIMGILVSLLLFMCRRHRTPWCCGSSSAGMFALIGGRSKILNFDCRLFLRGQTTHVSLLIFLPCQLLSLLLLLFLTIYNKSLYEKHKLFAILRLIEPNHKSNLRKPSLMTSKT